MERRRAALFRIILRVLAMAFAGVVAGCIGHKLLHQLGNQEICYFDFSSTLPCELGIACGGMTIFIGAIFTILDLVDVLTSESSTLGVISASSSVALSCQLASIWLACFSYLTHEWLDVTSDSIPSDILAAVRTVLAFSFISTPLWVAVAVSGVMSLRSLRRRVHPPLLEREDLPPRYSE